MLNYQNKKKYFLSADQIVQFIDSNEGYCQRPNQRGVLVLDKEWEEPDEYGAQRNFLSSDRDFMLKSSWVTNLNKLN
ncbi:hypothetical protein [Paenibacillus cellulositrophicus]|uniref:hypothetical protein n=1 Tax=Paenibacillus cellulositrophicus TaxID=562959 RepID=UPI003D9810F4